MTPVSDVERLIYEHLSWLRPRVRTAVVHREPPTIEKRRRLLWHAERRLPYGLLFASDHEIVHYLSAWTGWSRYTYDSGLRTFYRWAARNGQLALDPMVDVPKPPQGAFCPHPCTDHELAVALTAPAPYGRAALLASRTGLRCGELARARRRHVAGRRLRVVGKGGKERKVPLDDLVLEAIDAEPDYLLGREMTPEWLTDHQRAVWQSVGLADTFRLHSMRHWFATQLLRCGATIRQVQVLLGHASVTTTQGYTDVTDEDAAEAVSRLPQAGAAGPADNRPDGLREV